jgi:hypothetical protein
MPRYMVEHDFPNVGRLSPVELRSVAQQSERVLRELGPEIQWAVSYVAEDKVYTIYIARDEALVREHARLACLPISQIVLVRAVIDPVTGE